MTAQPEQSSRFIRSADAGDRYTATVGIGNELGEVRWSLPKTPYEPIGGVKITWTYDPRDAMRPQDVQHVIDALSLALEQMDQVRGEVWSS